MRRLPAALLLLPAAFTFSARLPSQEPAPSDRAAPSDPLVVGREKLQQALHKAATTVDTAFVAEWSDATRAPGKNDPVVVFFGNRGSTKGQISGSWHQGLNHFHQLGGNKDQLVQAGGRMLAKDDTTGWTLRAGRFADGNAITFLPDTQLLLEQLAAWDLAVVQRAVGSLDDRPIEVFSVTLNADHVTALAWADLLPDSMAANANPLAQVLVAGPGNAARGATPRPDSTIDLAIFVDPATGIVHKLHFRSWTRLDPRFANLRVAVAGGQRAVATVTEADEEEDEEELAVPGQGKPKPPLRYVDGLPERKRGKMAVREYVLRLTDHGQAQAPELGAEQRRLLGLPPR